VTEVVHRLALTPKLVIWLMSNAFHDRHGIDEVIAEGRAWGRYPADHDPVTEFPPNVPYCSKNHQIFER
jgi:hypothetical protein